MKLSETKIRATPSDLERKKGSSSRISVLNEDRSEITYLSIGQLFPYKKQARKIFEDSEIEALAETIKEHGIRQPLTVLRVHGEDSVHFEVISGERRLRAAKILSLEKIPCIIIEKEDKAEEIALIENIQRQDLHPLELAEALSSLIDKLGRGGQTLLEKKLGINQSKISELLSLLNLSPIIKQELLKMNYRGRDNLRKLVSLKDEKSQLSFLKPSIENSSPAKREKKSIFKVSISDDKIELDKKSFNNLTREQKGKLKNFLLEILESL